MKIAIMQPYLFPYLGYYQLMRAVDHFVILDDGTYIKGGWINRNQILVQGRAGMFSVPLDGGGSHVKICDVQVDGKSYPHWRTKFFKTLTFNYRRAPYFGDIEPLVAEVIPAQGTAGLPIRQMAAHSLLAVMRYLGLSFSHSLSSEYAKPDGVKGTDRVLFLCQALGATEYYNPPGGRQLYDRDAFRTRGVELKFLTPHKVPYAQRGADFVPWLSMLDILMFNSPEAVRTMLFAYDLS